MRFAQTNTPLKKWLIILLCQLFIYQVISAHALASNIDLPDIGSSSGNLLTPAEEQRLGRAFMRHVRNTMTVENDPLMDNYIRLLGARLVTSSESFGNQFNFFIVNNPQINAFAGPGGNIGVYSGLLMTTQSESELASVMAHEIAHVTQQHLARTFDDAQRLSLPATALAIAALVIGAAADNPQAGAAAASGIQAGMAQRQINFTRSNEEEADHVGIQILATAGFEPRAMPTFFGRMGKTNRLYDSGKLPEFLRTHPVTSNRIADAYGRADEYNYRQQPDSLEYHLVRTRLRVAAIESAADSVAYFQKSLEEGRYRNETAQRYGFLLSLIANRAYEPASQQLQILLKKHPHQTAFIVAKADLEKASGNPQQSLQTLREGLQLVPDNYPLTLYTAQALLDAGEPKAVIEMLSKYLADRPNELELYKLMAQASGDIGNKTEGHRYLSEYYYQSGALKRAKQHLEFALKDRSLDYYQSAKLAARLKEIREEIASLEGDRR